MPAATTRASVALLFVAISACSSAERTEMLPSVCICAAKGPAGRQQHELTTSSQHTGSIVMLQGLLL